MIIQRLRQRYGTSPSTPSAPHAEGAQAAEQCGNVNEKGSKWLQMSKDARLEEESYEDERSGASEHPSTPAAHDAIGA